MEWKRLRFATALCCLALAGVPNTAHAQEGCPWVIIVPSCGHPGGPWTCGNSGGVSCERCTYMCHGSTDEHTWDMCET